MSHEIHLNMTLSRYLRHEMTFDLWENEKTADEISLIVIPITYRARRCLFRFFISLVLGKVTLSLLSVLGNEEGI